MQGYMAFAPASEFGKNNNKERTFNKFINHGIKRVSEESDEHMYAIV